MGRLHDPRGSVDRATEEILIAPFNRACMQPGTHTKGDVVGGRRLIKRLLQRRRRTQRIHCVDERGIHAVAGHLDDDAAVVLDRLARQRVVCSERPRHPLAFLLPEPGAAFDVCEKKSRESGRAVHGENLPLL